MTTIHQLNSLAASLEKRVVDERQFTEDAARELLTTLGLLKEVTSSMENQIQRLFKDRAAALDAVLGVEQSLEVALEQSDTTISFTERLARIRAAAQKQ